MLNLYDNKWKIMACALVIAFLSACHSELPSDLHENYSFDNTVRTPIDSLFSTVEAIPLLFESEYYPANVAHFKVEDGLCFISDRNSVIHVFDNMGHPISSSQFRIGEGPEDYYILMGWNWDPFAQKIHVITPFKLLSYDLDFNLVSSISLPTTIGTKDGRNAMLFFYVYNISDHLLAFYLVPTSKDPFRIILFDTERATITAECCFDDYVIAEESLQDRYFFRLPSGDVLCQLPYMTPYIYSVDAKSEKLIPSIGIDYGSNAITREDVKEFGENRDAMLEGILNSKKSVGIQNLINRKWIVGIVKQGRMLKDMIPWAINRETGKEYKFDRKKGESLIFPLLNDMDEEYAYAVYEKDFILANPQLLMDKAPLAETILSPIEGEDFVLLKYRLR
ncbi:MAG: 6-bladed beta-propeller [Bacteroidales bacterium]|nr:6-bladed beta-propeller [Bacteroidales bacterium]